MIFVDTGAFCAYLDRKDDYHQLAVRQFSLLLNNKERLLTTNFVIDETYTWLRYKLGFEQAINFLRGIRQAEKEKPALRIVSITRSLENEALTLLEQFADQDLSFTDATSLAVIQQEKVKQVLCFDRHFYLLPIEIIPGVVRKSD